MPIQSALRIALAVVLGPLGLLAQGPKPHLHIEHLVPATSGQFGSQIFALSDRNGDGFGDFAVSAPSGPYPVGTGEVHVFSGRSGARLRIFLGDQFNSRFGETVVGLGDVNGDAMPDLAVGVPDYSVGLQRQGRVICFSGASGAVLWTRDGVEAFGMLGQSLQGISDVTGDGIPDLVAGEPGFGLDNRGRVRTISGANGGPLGDSEGSIALADFGVELVARAATVYAGDNVGRIFAITPGPGTLVPPLLHLATSTLVRPELALLANPAGGFDLAVGRRFEDPSGISNAGTVTLYAGGAPSMMPLLVFAGTVIGEGVGGQVQTGVDLDGDGIEEVLLTAGAPGLDQMRVRAVTRTGAVVVTQIIAGTAAKLASLPDLTGDGRGEWLVGVLSGVSSLAEANLWSGGLAVSAWTLGPAGLTAALDLNLGPAQSGRTWVGAYSLSGSSPGIVVPGIPLIPINFDALSQFLFEIAFTPGAPLIAGTLDVLGRATVPLSLPTSVTALLSQSTLTFTAVSLATTGIVSAANPLALPFP